MRQLFVPAIAAISLMAFPALAASTTSGMNPSTGSSQNTDSQNPGQASQDPGQIRHDLHQDLTQAGYTDIQITPGSFLVHAKDKQGHPIEMMISPNSVLEVATIPAVNSSIKTSSNMNAANTTGTAGSSRNGSAGQASK